VREPVSPEKTWSNIDIEADPQGYREAQQAYLEESEQYREQRNREQDLEDFRASFVEAGGDPEEAASVWQAVRNDKAAERAAALSTAVLTNERQRIARGL
jgi:hypothetical protein